MDTQTAKLNAQEQEAVSDVYICWIQNILRIFIVFFCLFQNKSAASYIEASKARISQYEKEVNVVIVLDHSEWTDKCLFFLCTWKRGKSAISRVSCAGQAM